MTKTDEQRAHALWSLLDDIDTLDDACKSNDVAFRQQALRICQRRDEHYVSLDGMTLTKSEEQDGSEDKRRNDQEPA